MPGDAGHVVANEAERTDNALTLAVEARSHDALQPPPTGRCPDCDLDVQTIPATSHIGNHQVLQDGRRVGCSGVGKPPRLGHLGAPEPRFGPASSG